MKDNKQVLFEILEVCVNGKQLVLKTSGCKSLVGSSPTSAIKNALLAQFGRAADLYSAGRGFDACTMLKISKMGKKKAYIQGSNDTPKAFMKKCDRCSIATHKLYTKNNDILKELHDLYRE